MDSCSAKIQTSSKTYFYIELMATCFEGVVKTAPNNDWLSCVEGDQYVKPVWRSREAVAKVIGGGGGGWRENTRHSLSVLVVHCTTH